MFKKITKEYITDACDATEWAVHVLLLLFLIVPLVVFCCYRIHPFEISFAGGACAFLEATGLQCIGCGGTRAIQYLCDLKIWESIMSNCIPVTAYVFVLAYLILFIIMHNKQQRYEFRNLMYLGVILIAYSYNIIRNYGSLIDRSFGVMAVIFSFAVLLLKGFYYEECASLNINRIFFTLQFILQVFWVACSANAYGVLSYATAMIAGMFIFTSLIFWKMRVHNHFFGIESIPVLERRSANDYL